MTANWTKQDERTLIELYRKGFTTTQIGAELGCSKNAVVGKINRIRSVHGRNSLPPRVKKKKAEKVKRPNGWTDDQISSLKELYNKGFSAAFIAAQLGRSRSAVCGKINRIREERGEGSFDRPKSTEKASRRSASVVIDPAEVPVSYRIPFLETESRHCRWIDDERGPDGFPTCCGHVIPDTPGPKFCAYHREKARGDGTPSERRALEKLTPKPRREAA